MKTIEKLKSAKRFGPRYGKRLKLRVAKIEEESRKIHKCPYCNYKAVKRVGVGIWFCRKCKAKFTGKAYSVEKKISFEEKLIKEEGIEKEKRGEEISSLNKKEGQKAVI